jgi:sulfur carrier protein ThiS
MGEKMALVRLEVRLGEKEKIIEVEEGTPVGDLIQQLEPQWRDNVLVIANGRVAKAKDLLNAADRILILPLLAGG